MKTIVLFVAAGLLATLPLVSHAKIVRVVEKSFPAQPGEWLTVETQGGDIRVEVWDQSTVKVVATQTIKTDSVSEADELLKRLTLTIGQTAEGVAAKAQYEKKRMGFRSGPNVQVSFVVSVPARYNAKLNTSGGNVGVGDLDGKLNVHTSGGNIELGKIKGDLDAHTSGGDVRLVEGAGSVKLATSGGNISVQRAAGVTDLKTSGGDIRIGAADNLIRASTSGGNVTADLIGPLKADCVLETSGGNVRVHVSSDAAFQLDASTGGGRVRADSLSLSSHEIQRERSRLSGKVNGGGPLLKLHSSGGDIVVETK